MIDLDSDDVDDMFGDVGVMVKGIGVGEDKGCVSFYVMNCLQLSYGNGLDSLLKLKIKLFKKFDVESVDEINYEMFVNLLFYKVFGKDNKLVDDFFLDDDEFVVLVVKVFVKVVVVVLELKKRGWFVVVIKVKLKEVLKVKIVVKSIVFLLVVKVYVVCKNSFCDEFDDEMVEVDLLFFRFVV